MLFFLQSFFKWQFPFFWLGDSDSFMHAQQLDFIRAPPFSFFSSQYSTIMISRHLTIWCNALKTGLGWLVEPGLRTGAFTTLVRSKLAHWQQKKQTWSELVKTSQKSKNQQLNFSDPPLIILILFLFDHFLMPQLNQIKLDGQTCLDQTAHSISSLYCTVLKY